MASGLRHSGWSLGLTLARMAVSWLGRVSWSGCRSVVQSVGWRLRWLPWLVLASGSIWWAAHLGWSALRALGLGLLVAGLVVASFVAIEVMR